ncbi:hypothetical protein ASPZODRAFT_158807 [Penicilliopsis zonata CBS 506.65]|uniref:RNA exonuclease 4 n=1 Tax=Penicilliopsis zonata CBS 506.65 TaxID=1073090 RepID=A0A1L9SLG0_9EURO|nr:hypothetical protein ASPZODRAFT_158807 [Penicilliopsis zonata CBS 506.65]OJJ47963.1 hypothetical protein ASPZODRAFT_158807 [Penicilliopsis zonata CBS 506.65]
MSPSVEAPQQFKQPSRKGKKAWRKNVDVTEVQEGLRVLKDEEIKGGLLSEKPSEELFTIDTTGSAEIRAYVKKNHKPLKADEILAARSAIPGVDTRKRLNSKVTDGVIEPKSKRQKSDWVSRKEWLRLKQVAKEANPIMKTAGNELYDPWANDEESAPMEDPRFDFLEKPKPFVAPVTLKEAPVSLAANGKPIPSVKKPTAGTSYNPSFEDWDRLLNEEGKKELEAEKQRLEEERKEQERQRLIAEAQNDDDEAKSDDESAWEGFESEYEKPEWLNKKRPERKTKAQRNKIKRRKEAERKAKWDAQMDKKEQQVEQAKAIAERIKQKEEEPAQDSDADDSEEGDDTDLRRRPFGGKLAAPSKPLELVLPEELQDSLRLLKPEGNLLDDRFRTLIVQGKLESRKPITQAKKAKRKATEKWTHKDFQIPGINWKKLQQTLKKTKPSESTATKRKVSEREADNGVKRRKTDRSEGNQSGRRILSTRKGKMSEKTGDGTETGTASRTTSRRNSTVSVHQKDTLIGKVNEGRSKNVELGRYVAMDCEMVGVGPNPDNDSALARVSIVNYNGEQVYDSYVRPKEMVTDWRTHVSGISPKHMVNARSLEQVQKDVAEILDGRVLVGHALRNDLDALLFSHPKRDIRDTSKHPPYRKVAGGGSPRLKILASEFLGLTIQEGAHSSVEDARATMLLYRRDKDAFEREHAKKWPVRVIVDTKENGDEQKKKKKKKKKTRKR